MIAALSYSLIQMYCSDHVFMYTLMQGDEIHLQNVQDGSVDDLLVLAFQGHGLSLADAAFSQLFQIIVSAPPNADFPLKELELSKNLNVSRTPLREALHRLELFGLVRRGQGRGVIVPAMSVQEMENVSRTRERLEGLIVYTVGRRYAAGEISLEGLERINRRVLAFRDIDDIEALLDAGLAFHVELRRLANNPFASQLLAQTLLRLERYRHLIVDIEQRGSDIHAEHETILECLRAKDPDGAERQMRRHLSNARRIYRHELFGMLKDTSHPAKGGRRAGEAAK